MKKRTSNPVSKSLPKSLPLKKPARKAITPTVSPEPDDGPSQAIQLPAVHSDVLAAIQAATMSGRWLIAVWHVHNGRLVLNRTAMNFPSGDLDSAMKLLTENLKPLRK